MKNAKFMKSDSTPNQIRSAMVRQSRIITVLCHISTFRILKIIQYLYKILDVLRHLLTGSSIALNGQVIGLGAGQQSRIHCTRLAGRLVFENFCTPQ